MKLQWADIHHSRLQDWSAIGVTAGALYALVNILQTEARVFLSALGLVFGLLGAGMAWQHQRVFEDKIGMIEKMERRLGI